MPRISLASILRFRLERLLERGPQYKLLLLWVLLFALSVLGGALAWAAPAGEFASLPHAIWWAFLNMSDPGYLAEEHAPGLRVLAIVLAVVGLAIFVGALVAVLTQSFNAWMAELSLGTTPVTFDDHVVVLGWTSRTPELIAALLDDRTGIDQVVVLVQRITPEIRQELREQLGVRRLPGGLVLRSGSPEQVEHLSRANCRGARAIVIPAGGPGSDSESDPRALKVVASLDRHTAETELEQPLLVVEMQKPELIPVVKAAYAGRLGIIPSDVVLGRALALGILYPGLSSFFADVLDPRTGSEMQVRTLGELAGVALGEAISRLTNGVLLGPLRTDSNGEEFVEWRPDAVLQPGEELLIMVRAGTSPAVAPTSPGAAPAVMGASPSEAPTSRRVLVVGWSDRVRDLLVELCRQEIRVEIDLLTEADPAMRSSDLAELPAGDGLKIRCHQGDSTSPEVLGALPLDSYDAIALVGSDLAADEESVDSRTIATLLVLDYCLRGARRRPHRIVELLDPANAALLEGRGVEVVKTPEFIGDSLAGAVAQPRLWSVMPKLLQGAMGQPCLVSVSSLLLPDGEAELAALESELRRRGMVWLGVQRAGKGYALDLAPDKKERIRAADGDHVVLVRPARGEPERTESVRAGG